MASVAAQIATATNAQCNCVQSGNKEWYDIWTARIAALEKCLPSGSGFDKGTTIEVDACSDERIVLHTAFHHMDQNGYYDGWTEHRIVVTATLNAGFRIKVGGRNKNQIKDYIAEMFYHALGQEYAWPEPAK